MSWNREKFEEELYSLQNDISQLSQKLSTSIPNTSASRRVSSAQKLVNGSQDKEGKKSSTQMKSDLIRVTHERDDALARLQHANEELEELRRTSKEAAKIVILYEHLKQDFESLQISFTSSEKIRKQQKELIQLLNKSREGVSLGYPAAIEIGSSPPAVNGKRLGSDSTTVASYSSNMFSPSVNDENRSWLNSFSKEAVVGKGKRVIKKPLSPRSNGHKLSPPESTASQSPRSQGVKTPTSQTGVVNGTKRLTRRQSDTAAPKAEPKMKANSNGRSTQSPRGNANSLSAAVATAEIAPRSTPGIGRPPKYPATSTELSSSRLATPESVSRRLNGSVTRTLGSGPAMRLGKAH